MTLRMKYCFVVYAYHVISEEFNVSYYKVKVCNSLTDI